MNITTVEDKERVICEPSYYNWWQMGAHPSFKEVLEKVCKECGSKDPPTIDDSMVISCSIHGVEITIEKLSSNIIKTKMKCKTAKYDWISQTLESDLFIPYFQCFLRNMRGVWYQQYKLN